MNRRHFLKRLTVFGTACCLPQLATKSIADLPQQPNILLIHVDDLGWADLAFNAPHDYYETPNINAFKDMGMYFTNGYAAAALCSPTRAALMTGKYPPRTGITNFITSPNATQNYDGYEGQASQEYLTPIRYQLLELDEITIPEVLKPMGYTTYHIGKWHLGNGYGDFLPDKQGYDVDVMGQCARDYYDPYDCPTLPDRDNGEYLTDRLTDEAIYCMQDAINDNKPFFVSLNHHAVHTPIRARADYVSHFENKDKPSGWEHLDATYAAMIKSLDDSVGKLVTELNNLGIENDTLVIFTSDNGGHQPVSDNTPLREGKRWPYEGGIREPWLFKWPGVITPGSICDEPISSIDVMPTVCDLAGARLPVGQPIDGVSILPLLTQTASLTQRDLFWYFPHYISDYTGEISPFAVIRSGKYKLIRWYDTKRSTELYDLEDDLCETTNLAQIYPKKTKYMQEKLDMWLDSVNAKRPIKNPLFFDSEDKSIQIG